MEACHKNLFLLTSLKRRFIWKKNQTILWRIFLYSRESLCIQRPRCLLKLVCFFFVLPIYDSVMLHRRTTGLSHKLTSRVCLRFVLPPVCFCDECFRRFMRLIVLLALLTPMTGPVWSCGFSDSESSYNIRLGLTKGIFNCICGAPALWKGIN